MTSNQIEKFLHFFQFSLMGMSLKWQIITACFAIALLSILGMAFADWISGPIREKHIEGVRIATTKELARRTRAKKRIDRKRQIIFGQIPWPIELQDKHALVVGTTGAGKSTLIKQLLPQIREQGGRAIVIDLNAEFAQAFKRPEDLIFNPLKSLSLKWNPLSEINSTEDIDLVLKASVPKGQSADDESWRGYTRQFLRTLMLRLREDDQLNLERLRYFVLEAGEKEFALFMQEGMQSYRIQANNMMSTVKTLAQNCIQALGYAASNGDFSIREWVQSGKGFIFITPRDKDLAALGPLITTFINLAIAEALSAPVKKPYAPITLVIDELASFDIDDITQVLEKGRKFGLVTVAGIQNIAQLHKKFGPDGSTTLMACFRTKVIFNPGDAETGKKISDEIGQQTVDRRETVTSRSEGRSSISTSWRREIRPAVSAVVLNSLPDRHAYLKFGGTYPVARVIIPLSKS